MQPPQPPDPLDEEEVAGPEMGASIFASEARHLLMSILPPCSRYPSLNAEMLINVMNGIVDPESHEVNLEFVEDFLRDGPLNERVPFALLVGLGAHAATAKGIRRKGYQKCRKLAVHYLAYPDEEVEDMIYEIIFELVMEAKPSTGGTGLLSQSQSGPAETAATASAAEPVIQQKLRHAGGVRRKLEIVAIFQDFLEVFPTTDSTNNLRARVNEKADQVGDVIAEKMASGFDDVIKAATDMIRFGQLNPAFPTFWRMYTTSSRIQDAFQHSIILSAGRYIPFAAQHCGSSEQAWKDKGLILGAGIIEKAFKMNVDAWRSLYCLLLIGSRSKPEKCPGEPVSECARRTWAAMHGAVEPKKSTKEKQIWTVGTVVDSLVFIWQNLPSTEAQDIFSASITPGYLKVLRGNAADVPTEDKFAVGLFLSHLRNLRQGAEVPAATHDRFAEDQFSEGGDGETGGNDSHRDVASARSVEFSGPAPSSSARSSNPKVPIASCSTMKQRRDVESLSTSISGRLRQKVVRTRRRDEEEDEIEGNSPTQRNNNVLVGTPSASSQPLDQMGERGKGQELQSAPDAEHGSSLSYLRVESHDLLERRISMNAVSIGGSSGGSLSPSPTPSPGSMIFEAADKGTPVVVVGRKKNAVVFPVMQQKEEMMMEEEEEVILHAVEKEETKVKTHAKEETKVKTHAVEKEETKVKTHAVEKEETKVKTHAVEKEEEVMKHAVEKEETAVESESHSEEMLVENAVNQKEAHEEIEKIEIDEEVVEDAVKEANEEIEKQQIDEVVEDAVKVEEIKEQIDEVAQDAVKVEEIKEQIDEVAEDAVKVEEIKEQIDEVVADLPEERESNKEVEDELSVSIIEEDKVKVEMNESQSEYESGDLELTQEEEEEEKEEEEKEEEEKEEEEEVKETKSESDEEDEEEVIELAKEGEKEPKSDQEDELIELAQEEEEEEVKEPKSDDEEDEFTESAKKEEEEVKETKADEEEDEFTEWAKKEEVAEPKSDEEDKVESKVVEEERIVNELKDIDKDEIDKDEIEEERNDVVAAPAVDDEVPTDDV